MGLGESISAGLVTIAPRIDSAASPVYIHSSDNFTPLCLKLYLTEEEAEAQRDEVAHLRSHSKYMAGLGFALKSV